jgi:hypothetical protein
MTMSRPAISSPLATSSRGIGTATQRVIPRRNASFPTSRALRPFPTISRSFQKSDDTSTPLNKKTVKLIEPPKDVKGTFLLDLTQAELSRQDWTREKGYHSNSTTAGWTSKLTLDLFNSQHISVFLWHFLSIYCFTTTPTLFHYTTVNSNCIPSPHIIFPPSPLEFLPCTLGIAIDVKRNMFGLQMDMLLHVSTKSTYDLKQSCRDPHRFQGGISLLLRP